MDADNAPAAMPRMAPKALEDREDGAQEPEFKPLTREEAERWRASQPELSPWRVVRVQWLVGLSLAALVGLVTRQAPIAWSLLYGAAATALPTALMAWGLTSSRLARQLAGRVETVFMNFVLWEGVKILLTVILLWIAPRIVPNLNWLALVAGLVVVLKVYWFGFLIQTRR
ncbi:ATP synthase subunit I [Hydrogenophaga sp.]|uniref:ATP synthase subunit I n=1 Tax=Hydrogenophaga sp. TaxID=1904254 RepID=UPI0035AF8091